MAKVTIHCVRHAQGFHNLSIENHAIADPLLTPKGKQECATLSKAFPNPSKITHLIASPLRRTLYTTLLSFPSAISRGLQIIALAELQETSSLPCDTGSSVEALDAEFSEGQFAGTVDLRFVEGDWNSKEGKWSPAAHHIEQRARSARLFLRALAQLSLALNPDQDVEMVVVTHGGYLHHFTNDWDGAGKFVGTGWANTEFRSYSFVDEEYNDGEAALKETRESQLRRRGHEIELTPDEQRTLKDSMEREWCESGYLAPREERAKL